MDVRTRLPWFLGIGAVLLGGMLSVGLIVAGSDGSLTSGDRIVGLHGPTPIRELPRTAPSPVWTAEPGGDWIVDVVGDDDTVYVALSDGGDVEIVAIDLSDGSERWRKDVPGRGGELDVAVAEGFVVATRFDFWADDGDDATVSALEVRTGDVQWDFEAGGGWATVSHLGGGRVLVRWDGEVAILDTRSGAQVWASDADVAAVHGDVVAFLDDEDLEVRSTSDDRLWDDDVGDDAQGVAVTERLVVVLHDDEITAYGRADGQERWDRRTGVEGAYAIRHLPGGLIMVFGVDETVVFDEEGTEVWDEDAEDLGWGDVIVQDGRTLIVRTEHPEASGAGTIAVYEATTGDRLARTSTGAEETAFPWEGSLLGQAYGAGAIITREGRSVRVYDLITLEELWEIRSDEQAIGQLPAGGGLVVVSIDGDEPVLEFFR